MGQRSGNVCCGVYEFESLRVVWLHAGLVHSRRTYPLGDHRDRRGPIRISSYGVIFDPCMGKLCTGSFSTKYEGRTMARKRSRAPTRSREPELDSNHDVTPSSEDTPLSKELVVREGTKVVPKGVTLSKKEIKNVRLTRKKLKKLKKLRGEFKRDLPDIYQLMDAGGTARHIQRRFYTGVLAAVVDLIPVLESRTSKSAWDRDVYALNAVITQGLDILGKMQELDDQQQQAHDLNNDVIMPMYNIIMHQFINCLSILRENLESSMRPEAEMHIRAIFQTSAREFGAYLDAARTSAKENVLKHLG